MKPTNKRWCSVKRAKKVVELKSLGDLYISYLMDESIQDDDYHAIFFGLAKNKFINNPLNPGLSEILKSVKKYRTRHRFFHWALEFPDIFQTEKDDAPLGFSATVGNPPWNIVKPLSQEFFSAYDPNFRSYKKKECDHIVEKMMGDNPLIERKWKQYCQVFYEQRDYFRKPLIFPALGKGDVNTYVLFLEQFFKILNEGGYMGIVVPSGFYTDKGCKPIRELLFNSSKIAFIYGFENRWPNVFTAVDGRFKFVVFGTKKGGKSENIRCVFMEHDPIRLPLISANALEMNVNTLKKLSPDALSFMEFKSQRDIDVTTKIYGEWPLLGERLGSFFNVVFKRELHMTDNSSLFHSTPTAWPLFEGKMIYTFDSIFGEPRYWLERTEVEENSEEMPGEVICIGLDLEM